MNKKIPARLYWACRRGMLELDILLEHFLKEKYLHLSVQDKQIFVQLLSIEDQDLFMWLMGKQAPERLFKDIIEKIRYHASTRHSASSF